MAFPVMPLEIWRRPWKKMFLRKPWSFYKQSKQLARVGCVRKLNPLNKHPDVLEMNLYVSCLLFFLIPQLADLTFLYTSLLTTCPLHLSQGSRYHRSRPSRSHPNGRPRPKANHPSGNCVRWVGPTISNEVGQVIEDQVEDSWMTSTSFWNSGGDSYNVSWLQWGTHFFGEVYVVKENWH